MARKRVIGKVISNKMQKTIVIVSEILKKHKLYGKYIRHKTKYYVHDEKNIAKIGDRVLIEFTRPISKLKNWRLVKILNNDDSKQNNS
ncbi:MAG: 30S ribosomal protein S17 [Candidatus Parcubacteria bacterium]|nr:MAG: 30S ribosomal protein S17 [Candidatus Parcubacteria bacterium]